MKNLLKSHIFRFLFLVAFFFIVAIVLTNCSRPGKIVSNTNGVQTKIITIVDGCTVYDVDRGFSYRAIYFVRCSQSSPTSTMYYSGSAKNRKPFIVTTHGNIELE